MATLTTQVGFSFKVINFLRHTLHESSFSAKYNQI